MESTQEMMDEPKREMETTAKTVEEAIELGLRELDAERGEVEIDVVSKGKAGILGIGGEPARVRVTLLEKPNDIVRAGTRALEGLISAMGVEAYVNLKIANVEDIGGPLFDIDGEDAGLLIGRRGETLRALQFLARLMVSRELGVKANLLVDVAGYQERRNESLRSMAYRVAESVVRSGRSVKLEPMPPNERRIVHIALVDNKRVVTYSTGTGEGRQIVVELAED